LAYKPNVLLLDEPFGALDAKIREELRRTIREVQRELKISTILVTHDQEEAFGLADRIGVMNLGRLLEIGRPEELYARPATRFVATFLGAANLLLARQTVDGIRVGTTPISARLAERVESNRETEVVAVLRPEEIELAANRDHLTSAYIGQAVVESKVFTGALERIRLRMLAGSDVDQAPQINPAGEIATLEVTRTQYEQRTFPVLTGQSVVIGVRRIHVLPTPLSSFAVYGATEESAAALCQHPLLEELAARMKTRVFTCSDLGDASAKSKPITANQNFAGVAVVAAGPQLAQDLDSLLERGATEILVLPERAPSPQRVLIHWNGEEARRATLAVAASLLRHVAAEAVYVGILPGATPERQRPSGVRDLLDARSEAQAVHGLEMRTELRFGDEAQELTRQLEENPEQMLILGFNDPAQLKHEFAPLLQAHPGWPLLLVYRPRETVAAQRRLA
jgi:hypothetical protein